MREYTFKNNNHFIVSLVFAIGVLMLLNGAMVFWQMQQVKQAFNKVVNRDLPLVAQLSPLIDRQFEQTLLIEKLHDLKPAEQNQVLELLREGFLRTGQKFDQTLYQLTSFVRIKMAAATAEDHKELDNIRMMLEAIAKSHQRYEQKVIWMVDGMQGKNYDYSSSFLNQVYNQQQLLAVEMADLDTVLSLHVQQSKDTVQTHDTLVLKQLTAFILLGLLLAGVLLYYLRQLMLSRQRAVEEINYHATFDSLTKLLNRRYFDERLEQAIKTATRHDQPLSMCVCDIDNFSQVVASYGEHGGDIALAGFADILAEQMRATDVAGRFGPDEFVFFFPNTCCEEAQQMLSRIRRLLNAKTFTNDKEQSFKVTATFGVSELNFDHKTSAALTGAADRALFKAKAKGQDLIFAL